MKYRKLGRTNLSVSEIGHGLWGMGDWKDASDKGSLETLQMSLEMGCTFFDSAWSYGNGHSDKLLGKIIKNNPAAEIIIASKIPPKNLKWPGTSKDELKDVFPYKHVVEYTEKILENV